MKPIVKMALLALVIVAALAVLRWQLRPPAGSATNHEYAGRTVAAELARLCGDRPARVLAIGFAGERRTLNQQIAGFQAALREHPQLTWLGREDLQPSDFGGQLEGGGFPAAPFLAALERHRDADWVVSFVGLPDARDARTLARFRTGPRLAVVNGNAADLADLVQQGVLALAVVHKPVDMANLPGPPRDPSDWFSRFFQIVAVPSP